MERYEKLERIFVPFLTETLLPRSQASIVRLSRWNMAARAVGDMS